MVCDTFGRFCDPEFEFQVAKPAAGSHWGEVLELFAVSETRKPVSHPNHPRRSHEPGKVVCGIAGVAHLDELPHGAVP